MKKLTLPLIKHWYNLTDDGVKKEDYRDINIYWCKRLIYNLNDVLLSRKSNYLGFVDDYAAYNFITNNIGKFGFKEFDVNRMTLGYPKSTDKSRIIEFEHAGIEIGFGVAKWGADPEKKYFIIKHGKKK